MGLLNIFSRKGAAALLAAAPDGPCAAEHASDAVEDRLPLHVVSDAVILRIEGAALRAENTLTPLNEIAHITLQGGSGISAPCLRALCEAQIPLVIASRSGFPVGLCEPLGHGVPLRAAQYMQSDCLPLARGVVETKIAATLRLAKRRRVDGPVLNVLRRSLKRARTARSHGVLMGIEGAAAAAWYGAWPGLLRRNGVSFTRRMRRPPGDIANAALSYGYGCVTTACLVAARTAGLDPALGVLHGTRAGRAAMALDLAEPFRVAICDAAILEALNTGALTANHTEDRDGGTFLTDAGRKVVLRALERRWSTPLKVAGRVQTWRSLPPRHARAMARSIRHGNTLNLEGPW